MTRHLSDDAALALAEGRGEDALREHAAACAECSASLEEARAGLELARRAEVPEPSPLYWEALRRNVERQIAGEPRRRWAWLAPLVATAAVVAVVAVTTVRPPAPSPPPEPGLAAWSALPPEAEDASLEVLEGLAVAERDLRPLDEGQGVGAFLASLSDEESRALADSLRGQGGAS